MADLHVHAMLCRRKVERFHETIALLSDLGELPILGVPLWSAMLHVEAVLGVGKGESLGERCNLLSAGMGVVADVLQFSTSGLEFSFVGHYLCLLCVGLGSLSLLPAVQLLEECLSLLIEGGPLFGHVVLEFVSPTLPVLDSRRRGVFVVVVLVLDVVALVSSCLDSVDRVVQATSSCLELLVFPRLRLSESQRSTLSRR